MANQAFGKAEDLLFGGGELYVEIDGDDSGWKHLGNVDEFVITTTVESIEKNASMNMKRELMAKTTTAISITAEATLTEYDYKNVALALFGDAEVKVQSATTIVRQNYFIKEIPCIITMTDASGNRCFGIKDIALFPNISSQSGYIKDRDFIIDDQSRRAGIIKIPSNSSIAPQTNIFVSCAVPRKELCVISGGNIREIVGKLLFVPDANAGPNYVIEGWRIKIYPEGDLAGLISNNEFGSYKIKFSFIADYENHPEAPYYAMTLVDYSLGGGVEGEYDANY